VTQRDPRGASESIGQWAPNGQHRAMDVPRPLRRAVELDPTLVLVIAAEACVSPRSVRRWLDEQTDAAVPQAPEGSVTRHVRANTAIAIKRAWERVTARAASGGEAA
jgi:hypothetical protein